MESIWWKNPRKSPPCLHSTQSYGFNRFIERIQSWSSSNGALCCKECIKEDMGNSPTTKKVPFNAKFIWVCLDCDQIFCGVERLGQPDGHIRDHAISTNHLFAVQIAAWCFVCQSIQQITAVGEKKELNSSFEVEEEFSIMEQEDFNYLQGGYVVRRMKNLGNSCFFNATLQTLLSMDVLRAKFSELDCPELHITNDLWSLFTDTSHLPDDDDMTIEDDALLASIRSRVPNFQEHQQQDCHELLIYLLNELRAERTCFIEEIFLGMLSSTVSCVKCGNSSKSCESFFDLSLTIPSNGCSNKKDEVTTSRDLVLPALEISPWPSNGNSLPLEQYWLERTAGELSAPEPLDLSSQLLRVHTAKRRCFSRKKASAKVEKEGRNEDLIKVTESLESQQKAQLVEVEEDPEDCCGQHPCICNKDFGGVVGLAESQKKDHIAEEVEEDPEDCCGQHPCICNKDFGVAESTENQQKGPIKGQDDLIAGGEDLIAEVDNPIAEVDNLIDEVDNLIAEEEDQMSFYGQHSSTCNSDWSKFAMLLEGRQALFSGEEDSVKFQDVPKVENFPTEKLCEQNDNLNSDIKLLSVKQNVYSRKRPRCASSLKFEGEMQNGNNNGDLLTIEMCLELFTAAEILSGEYVCDHCSNHSRDGMQTELQSTGKNEKFKDGSQLGAHEAMDEVKPEVESKEEGVDVESRKVKVEASKRYLLFKAPHILTIHLKRFTLGTGGISEKINSHVNIQEMLDLTPYLDPSCEDKGKQRYRLIGVVEHVGVSVMCGHYIAYVRGLRRRGNGLAWFRASDEDVREVSSKEVLDSNAYILFYERTRNQ